MKYNEEMVKAGVMLAGEGLHPSSKGARVTFSNGRPTVIDGPFTETKELIAGYSMISVGSRRERSTGSSGGRRARADGNVELEPPASGRCEEAISRDRAAVMR